ncbi:pkinase-domain-containing protein [Lichtheimia corymbifera JMRC:FSU:9682]|uniref:Pkinase-domain-containing protein n=1 Tax=Lichtheimia corymbifera JMRC:FSU:9682 TaxID=1263082 RepID=A0A068RUD8_9FUNG|nr:pkinase-domain-containing protein [Lichtheimia corymbifera JMRC:FSU:9682]
MSNTLIHPRLYDTHDNRNAALDFINTTCGLQLQSDNLFAQLQDGIVLCNLINALKPGAIPSIGTHHSAFVKMANISLFLKGARELGVPSSDLFQPVDLYEARNMGAVVNTILTLARMSSRKKRQYNSTRKHHTERDRSSARRTSISRLFKNAERGGTAPIRKQFDSLPNKYRDESSRHRHVKAIFGQASQVTDDTPPTTLSVVDTNRITEKAEALRRTFRSNLRPTLDSGYSTMATRSGDVQGVTRRRRRRRRSSGSCSSMDYNSSTSEGVISTTDTDTDTADEEDKEGVVFTQKEQQRASSTSTASSSTRPESPAAGADGCQQHDMMGDDHLFLCVSSDHEPYPRSSLSTPCYAESRRPLLTPSPTPDHHHQHHLESKSSDDLKEENNRSACSKESSMIAMKQDKDNTTTYFQLGNCIGKGQFGAVYRALNVQTGEIVAIKRIRIEDIQVDSEIMQEVELLKDMDNANIVRYLGSVRDDTYLNIVLEYVENGSLLSTLKAFGKFPEALVASYTQKILSGLAYLHEHEVVHCDLKAANILSTKTGDVKLTDFGVSLNLRMMQDELGAPAGTPNWMAPEVIELKGASTKSDIWSLGCTIIELLTGRPPYAGMIAMSALYHIVEDDHPPVPENASETLQDLLYACFQKDPSQRPTAKELMQHPWISSALATTPDQQEQQEQQQQSNQALEDDYNVEVDTLERAAQVDPHLEDDDDDLAMIYQYMRTNPTMDSQRVAASNIRKKQFIEHQFVKTMFGKAVTCKVCMVTVKRHAYFCEACALICHDKCRHKAASCRPIYPTIIAKNTSQHRDSYPPRAHNKLQKMLASLYL